MKVALVVNELNIRGGTHKQLQRLAEYLKAKSYDLKIFTKFYDPTLCFPDIDTFEVVSYEKYFNTSGVSIISSRIRQTFGYWKMTRDIVRYSSIINIHDNGFALSQLFIKLFYRRARVIWQINDLPPYFRIGNTKHTASRPTDILARILYKYCAKSAHTITVNVSKNAERVYFYYGVKAEILYCGVDLPRNNIKELPRKSKDKIHLLSIGVFFPYRNYETYLKSIDLLNNQMGINCEGLIVGSTALDPVYSNKIQGLIDLNNTKCKILGNISNEQLSSIYDNSDCFLFLNQDQSWGLAVFEAMNMGVPVIVSKSVGATELLTDNLNCMIVDPTDHLAITNQIISIMNDYDLRSRLRKKAFELTLDMTWDRMYSSKIEKIINNLA